MNYLLRYHERLGDIVRCLPIARHLNAQGHNVAFECKQQYHSLFDMVGFCAPVSENHLLTPHRCLDLQIWPARFNNYLASGKTWGDFVYGLYAETALVPEIVSERDVFGILADVPQVDFPQDTALVCSWGFSQVDAQGRRHLPDVHLLINEALKRPGIRQCAILRPPGVKDAPEFMAWEASSIPELCAWIKSAPVVATIDSAPNALAAAVGRTEWIYFPSANERNNFRHPNQETIKWF
jgi:hypothetical protein